MTKKSLFPEAERVLTDLGLPESFLLDLFNEPDDWSFIIKIHALVEGVTTHLLTLDLDDERLREVFSQLELSNQKSGKVAFIKALGLIPQEGRSFISALSELRNSLVHRIENVHFELNGNQGGALSKSLERLLRATEKFWKLVVEIDGKGVKRSEFVDKNRRLVIWMGALGIIEEASPYMPNRDDLNAKLVRALLKAQRKASNRVTGGV